MMAREKNLQLESHEEFLKRLYKRHLQGAFVRSGASFFMWLFVIIANLWGVIDKAALLGVSASVGFLILINPPTLFVLRRIASVHPYKYVSLLINQLEIIGYTAIIYFLGGIEATYLCLTYAALIAYVGVVAPAKVPFIVATLCAITFSLMIVMVHLDILPNLGALTEFSMSWPNQLFRILVIVGLLFVIAFISSYTAALLKKNRNKLREQNEELQLAVEKTRESDRLKSEFLANMSHELRTPLNHIIGFTELVTDKKPGELNEAQEDYLNDVLESSRHLLSLINEILDLSKIEAGKMELNLAEFDLRNLLQNSLVMVREKAIRHNIQLSMEIDGVPNTVRADERKLKQIIYNLLSNAVKFTPNGGSITLSAKVNSRPSASATPQVSNSNGDFVEISVSDSGIGVAVKDIDRIFMPFEQADSSASREYPGTGLGLTLAKRMVELHGGNIWVESDGRNRGSKFSFSIPV